MASLLDAIPKQIFSGFRGKLLPATLTVITSSGVSSTGDATTLTETDYTCEGFLENYNEYYRAQAGIPNTDLKWNVFAASLPAGIEPSRDDKVKFRGDTYRIRTVETDPAKALWYGRAFKI